MSIDADTRAVVTAALSSYSQYYSKKDPERLMAMMAPEFFGFGSGPDEKITSRDSLRRQLERDFGQSDDISIEFGPMSVAYDGNVAWCAGDCTIIAIVNGERLRLDGRMTVVLRRLKDQWLFAHIHFSVPDRTQEVGKSFPTRK